MPTKFMFHKLALSLFVLTLGTLRPALAHSVWIEPSGKQLVVRFAEPGDDFETSPGYLDNLSLPVAFALIANKPVVIESMKKHDHFLLVNATATNPVCIETSFTVRGNRKPNFYARWQPVGTGTGKPLLTLDLVPTGKPGEVRAWFRGKPLGNITATLYTPDGNESDVPVDADGFLHFKTDQPGQYLLTLAHHREPIAGFYQGQAYEETSSNAALSWQQP